MRRDSLKRTFTTITQYVKSIIYARKVYLKKEKESKEKVEGVTLNKMELDSMKQVDQFLGSCWTTPSADSSFNSQQCFVKLEDQLNEH